MCPASCGAFASPHRIREVSLAGDSEMTYDQMQPYP
jgi:hypothetical protein